MEFIPTDFQGLTIIKPRIFGDDRGYFLETYNSLVFEKGGISERFVQDNQSKSKKGVLRGLHFQKPPHAQGKLVSVLQGSVLDVVVDIRKKSEMYGKHFSIVLSGAEKNMLFVPPGFAHGFLTLEDDTIFTYKCTANYHPESEDAIKWDDPSLGIDWNITDPIISGKDKIAQSFQNFETPFQ